MARQWWAMWLSKGGLAMVARQWWLGNGGLAMVGNGGWAMVAWQWWAMVAWQWWVMVARKWWLQIIKLSLIYFSEFKYVTEQYNIMTTIGTLSIFLFPNPCPSCTVAHHQTVKLSPPHVKNTCPFESSQINKFSSSSIPDTNFSRPRLLKCRRKSRRGEKEREREKKKENLCFLFHYIDSHKKNK